MIMTQDTIAEKKQRRLHSIDFARGIAIILIVWAHVDKRMSPIFYEKNLEYLHYIIYSFHVPLFFVISAAFLRRSTERYNNSVSFLKAIISRILLPFYSLGLIFLVCKLLAPESLSIVSSPSAKEMIVGLFLMQSDLTRMPSGVLWFLFALFECSFIVYFLHRKLKFNIYLILVIGIITRLISPYLENVHLLCAQKVSKMFLFFVIGYISSKFILKGETPKPMIYMPLLFACWLVSFLFMPEYQSPPVAGAIAGTAGSFFVLGICFKIKHSTDNLFLKFFYYCGQNSILIYVLHTSVTAVMANIIYHLNLSSNYWGFLVMLASGILLPLLIGIIVSFNASVYRVLFGRYPVYL